MEALLDDVTGVSSMITLIEETDSGVRRPSFAIRRPGTGIDIRFAAIPLGHEFTSLVLALLQVGGHPSKLDEIGFELRRMATDPQQRKHQRRELVTARGRRQAAIDPGAGAADRERGSAHDRHGLPDARSYLPISPPALYYM